MWKKASANTKDAKGKKGAKELDACYTTPELVEAKAGQGYGR